MKVWTNNTFKGYYPVGTAAVVVAETQEAAAKYLNDNLLIMLVKPIKIESMVELSTVEGTVRVLCDGNY